MTIRVLCVTLTSDRPETESFVGLRAAGIDFRVMCTPGGWHYQRLTEAAVPVTPIEFARSYDRRAIAQIRTALESEHFDILHLYHNKPVMNGLAAARGMPLKIVVYRGIVGNVSFLDPISWMRYLNPRIDRIICVADAIKNHFLAMRLAGLRMPPEKPVRIYKGHDLAWYDAEPADLESLGIPAGAFVAGCVANYRPRKGIELLIRACRHVPADVPLHLLLVGRMDHPRVQREIAASPMRDRIHLLGFRRDAPSLVAACDVAVLPALKREGLPRSVIEAMAYAVPPIVTDSGGSPELVVPGESGVVVPSGDERALADAMTALYRDPARRAAMGARARERIGSHFRIETTIAQTAALYRELTGKQDGKNASVQ